MFTLGNKEAIVNSPLQFPFTPAAATTSANLNIKGFGTFIPSKITGASGRRYSAEQLEKMMITCPTPAALGIAATDMQIPVTVSIRINSVRQASETAIDFIKRGRPLILEIKVDGATGGGTSTTVATALKNAIDELKFKYPSSTIPLTVSVSTLYVTIEATEGIYSFGDTVTFIKRGDVLPTVATTSKTFHGIIHVSDASIGSTASDVDLDGVVGLCVNDTIQFLASSTIDRKITDIVSSTIYFTPALTAASECVTTQAVWKTQKAVEAVGTGKILEEVTRMSTQLTSDSYAINANQVPIIGGKYTQITWSMDTPAVAPATGGFVSHLNQGAVGAAINNQTFTLYFNEDNCLATGGLAALLVTWLEAQSAVTFADFKKANGASAASTADFIA
jgi:hypothetical protein